MYVQCTYTQKYIILYNLYMEYHRYIFNLSIKMLSQGDEEKWGQLLGLF